MAGKQVSRENTGRRKSSRHCRCPEGLPARIPLPGKKLTDEQGLTLVRQAKKAGLKAMCRSHLRLLASGALGLNNNTTVNNLLYRVEFAYRYRHRLEKLWARKASWFRRNRRPTVPEDELGVFRHVVVKKPPFEFDEEQVFERFAGERSWQTWLEDGTINIPEVFSYLDEAGLRQMIGVEFDMYRHHHRTPPGRSRMGWRRNMYYSLVQQVVRQDPVWYALTVAARPDKQWRLISYPYITKDTDSGGEKTGFLHLDLDLEAYLASGRGGSRLTSSLSLDDEEANGCTVLVKGFHRHILEWIEQLIHRGWKSTGPTANCNKIYQIEDRKKWGEAVGVPCPAWGVRLTLAQLIHGSTLKSTRRRRTILPWFMGIDEDHKNLEVAGCLGWNEVRRCHLDLEVPKRDPSGYGYRMGAAKGRFPGSVVLGSSSALGDALIGRRKWTDPEVLQERNVLLGPDTQAAWEYVQKTRACLVEQYQAAFISMVKIEQESYGKWSYFAEQQPREDENVEESDTSMGLDVGSDTSSEEEE